MAVLQLQDVSLASGAGPVLDRQLNIERGEQVCLVGRNGQGKSCLMKSLLALKPDSGSVKFDLQSGVAYLQQDVPEDITGTVFDVVSDGHGGPPASQRVRRGVKIAAEPSPEHLEQLRIFKSRSMRARDRIFNNRLRTIYSDLNSTRRPVSIVVGGMKRRVSLSA